MKQLIFLLLFPCLAMAQYPGNANQKITLGEQTTADGLVYRGVANLDTVAATSKITRANKLDTSAYLLLDTVTNLLWHYKIGSNAWTQAGGSTLDTATMLLPYWRSGRFTGVLPLDNGGTGSTTQNFVDLTTTQSIGGVKTFTSAVTGARFNPTENTATGTGMFLPTTNTLGFSTDGTNRMTLNASGRLLVNRTTSTNTNYYLQVTQGISSSTSVLAQGTLTGYNGAGVFMSYESYGGRLESYDYSTSNWKNIAIVPNGGNVGIGTESPSRKLDVVIADNTTYAGNADNANSLNLFNTSTTNETFSSIRLGSQGAGSAGIVTLYGVQTANAAGSGYFAISTRNAGTFAERMRITSGGTVTINNLAGTGNRNVIADVNGLLSAPTSSIMTKENVQVLNYGLNEILQINPVSFDYIDKNKWGDERNLGFIVEDMYPIIPEVTGTMNNGDMYLDMVKLIPVLTKAIQEQNALIKALEQRILNLENK